ncbi:PREDICTED: uncharacterized protein LOC105558202 isoform X2 [Vollenhovia emeryi]|uniref:uncharacterized protein LOC105558202 isoform X2 n=1 Tax=Vollenhovia emeryi TaxID=411798 RepID=UPI0005F38A4B|nr:PREDICTED: uncharacterized protein LOC105558202 isoform X2 [Vollenhovia emeryi]
MSNSPRIRKMPPRPKILLPVPGQYYPQAGTGMGYVPTPYGQTPVPMTPVPMTPVSGQPQVFYANRASEFVFTQFKGIKDLTKSGLSVGEKSAYWLYEKKRDAQYDSRTLRRLGTGVRRVPLERSSGERADAVRARSVRLFRPGTDGQRRASVVILERRVLLWHHLHDHSDCTRVRHRANISFQSNGEFIFTFLKIHSTRENDYFPWEKRQAGK